MITNLIHWEWKTFGALDVQEWHDLLKLRIDVFVVEQDCPYPELDGKDPEAIHVVGWYDSCVVAIARILPPGSTYEEVSIGRVATANSYRRKGLGKALMEVCFAAIEENFGKVPIRISAQTYLIAFYQSLGFRDTGKYYLEDGIPHLEMYRPASL